MLHSLKELDGYKIIGTDDDLGKVHDFFFDDKVWTIRYLVIGTGNWFPGKKVLVSPASLNPPDWSTKSLPVKLTTEQIKNSPPVDTEKPVSRQHEIELAKYYYWPMYWESDSLFYPGFSPETIEVINSRQESLAEEVKLQADPRLRSADKVAGYSIKATNDDIGHVEDFIVNDETWNICYMVVDTRNWFPGGKKTLVSPLWISKVDWHSNTVEVDVTKERIENAPEYDPSTPINREYETRFYDYHGRSKYWV